MTCSSFYENASIRAACLLPLLAFGVSYAATTDISNAPLFTSSNNSVKPNIMFIMDDSGSMKSAYLPDDANFATTKYGMKASQCNGVAYNPEVVYSLPVNAAGVPLAPASLTFITPNPITQTDNPRKLSAIAAMPAAASGTITVKVAADKNGKRNTAWYDKGETVTVYNSGDSSRFFVGTVVSWDKSSGDLKINLADGIVAGTGAMADPRVADGQPDSATYYRYTGSQRRLGYTYTSLGVIKSTDFYKQCDSVIGSFPGNEVFTPVAVTSFSAEAQNYANWYQYYRTRMTMMKSSISLAFKGIDSRYRIGYSTISEETAVEGDDFLNMRDFDGTQKASFYTAFNAAQPIVWTPLRGALSKAGQYYANKARSQTVDPVQYSCQRNFTILSTDGYWNTPDESTTDPKYGPYGLDRTTAVGQQDAPPTRRPMLDGSTSSTSGGSSNSLADVAAYYYNTDLRSSALGNCTGAAGSDVCENNVPGSPSDAAHSFGDNVSWQHMTTFTLGLGISGLLTYDPNYLTQLSGDFYEITNGTKNWPVSGPTKSAENVDDLWHAAVNGHGQYFSAGDPASLSASLSSALDSIKATTGAAAAASTSSLQPVEGDNDIYVAQFTSVKWIGDLLSYKINPTTGAISTKASWSAKTQLDLIAPASRTIYYRDPSGTALKAFNYANLTADSYAGHFDGFCAKVGANGGASPAQCTTLGASDKSAANSGANLVAFLRGDRSMDYYRTRESALGDVINASPLFVGKPSFRYLENGYPSFASTNAGRTAVILVAANDGMLHAFDRATGSERWAYVPSLVIPKLYKLADTSFATSHGYYVDGSPQMGDIYVGGQWRTIVVGGLGGGGRGYYALDVTNPASPTLLWEFSNTNLGLSFGNPVITKRADGTWVVVFASGYNNVSPGDGNGHLFVLNASTGALLMDVPTYTAGSTPAGTTGAPSGLTKVNAWTDSDTNNLARRFYGGDLMGNLWRFDIDNLVQPHQRALLLAELKIGSTPQSIMVKPALGEVVYNGVNYPVVYVATGRYLGTSDLSNTSVQSVYAIKDPLIDSSYGDINLSSALVSNTLTAGTDAAGNATRAVTALPVNWATQAGWKANFPGTGERVSVNPQLVLSTLYVGTNLPSSDACTVGGSSFLYKFDIATGSTVANEPYIGTYVGNVLIQGLTTVQLQGGASVGSIVTILTRSDATLGINLGAPPSLATGLRRTSWRELVD